MRAMTAYYDYDIDYTKSLDEILIQLEVKEQLYQNAVDEAKAFINTSEILSKKGK